MTPTRSTVALLIGELDRFGPLTQTHDAQAGKEVSDDEVAPHGAKVESVSPVISIPVTGGA
jgi:hypothetical protein